MIIILLVTYLISIFISFVRLVFKFGGHLCILLGIAGLVTMFCLVVSGKFDSDFIIYFLTSIFAIFMGVIILKKRTKKSTKKFN